MVRLVAFIVTVALFNGVAAAMRPAQHLQCLMPFSRAIAALQQPPMPPPGNPDHQEPTPGNFCAHDHPDPAHNCACHATCVPTENEDGTQGPSARVEDAKCRAYCYKSFCRCPSECEP